MNCDLDGGFHSKATMGDRVWFDENQNGIQDSGEPRVGGVEVRAYDINGVMFDEAETDNNGEFFIDGLGKGEYYLKFDPPAGYTFTTPDQGGNEGMDSDVNGSNGPRTTALYRVNPGEHEPDVDAGLIFGVLPLELLTFDAIWVGDYVDVTWSTAQELNSSHFWVERRHETEIDFSRIGRVEAGGRTYVPTDYALEDYDIAKSGVYYYRLQSVDLDGSYEYSDIRVVNIVGQGASIDLYPNPTETDLNIRMILSQRSAVEILMYDELGRQIGEKWYEGELTRGQRIETLKVDQLPEGIYTVKVYVNGEETVLRFTKV